MDAITQGRVRLHQMLIRQGDPDANTASILAAMARAREDGMRIAVFPEWALSGFLAGPEWLDGSCLRACERGLARIVEASQGLAVVLGTVVPYRGRLAGAAVAAAEGRRVAPLGSPLPFVPKLLAPQNRFDNVSGLLCAGAVAAMEGVALPSLFAPFTLNGMQVVAWCGRALPNGVDTMRADAGLLLCLDTRPYTRDRPLGDAPSAGGVPAACCCGTGVVDTGKTLFVLAGGTQVRWPDGRARHAPLLCEAALDLGAASCGSASAHADHSAPRMVIEALEYACRLQLERLGLSRVVVGASGGIDSALTAALYCRVVGPEHLLLANMPSRHNSGTTISLARRLAANLDCYYTEIPIQESVELTRRQMDGCVCERPGGRKRAMALSDLAVENVQARDRSGRVLAALASAFGGVFTCNANKSECAVGYGTMYGDISGFFAALADLWKREVWELARCYNDEVFGREMIPQGSILIVPSAELSPAQNVDEGKGDPLVYAWHDRLFAAWTERPVPATLDELMRGYAEGVVGEITGYTDDVRALFPDEASFRNDLTRMWRLYNGLARAKRLQAPPVLSLKSRTFGFDLGSAQLPILDELWS
ncbi:MAG TPA: NAD(+) synthase [Kiritimatiellia bacterium]|nr:NAD(+) synthase [Kiritimatiellia bacterium]HRU69765.1 NAD(+) synthase [Kiritimatiellia bacterium]